MVGPPCDLLKKIKMFQFKKKKKSTGNFIFLRVLTAKIVRIVQINYN
jgi:hypothetical protein